MEVLLIGEAKMKIVLTAEETKKYGLDVPDPSKDTHRTRRAFWNVLDDARKQVKFDPWGDKVLVQFYPMKSGGCEIFVTKLGILSQTSAKLVSDSDRITLLSKKRCFYAFSSPENLHRAAKAIKNHPSGVVPKGDLYFLDNVGYVLAIEEYGRGEEFSEFAPIMEFGKRLPEIMATYIAEHGTLQISDTAVETASSQEYI